MESLSQHLLIVDDDNEIRSLLRHYLNKKGFENVWTAPDGEKAWEILGREPIALLILDIMLPGEDGFSIAETLRKKSDLPIIMLSARAETSDRIHGLRLGADDYLTKPFDPSELLERIHAILRRTPTPASPDKQQHFHFGGITLSMPDRVITREDGQRVALPDSQLKLLLHFLNRPNQILNRHQVTDELLGTQVEVNSRSIDVQVSRIREQIGDKRGMIIQTIRNQGYILSAPVEITEQ